MSAEPLPTRGGAQGDKQSFTPDMAVAQLTRSGLRWGRAGEASVTVTYAYRASGTVPLEGGATFSQFSARQIAAAELALDGWEDVANIRFERVTDGGSAYSDAATILFGNYTPNGADPGAAFALMPGSRSAASASGDVWISTSFDYNNQPVLGAYGPHVLAHEIGHAIGLSHPGNYDADDDSAPSYAADAGYYEDTRQYTIMSYFGSSNTGGNLGAFAAGPQMDDIAAIQRLYGANTATRSGDTVYGSHSNADRPYYRIEASSGPVVFSAWDGGGYDTFDFSEYGMAQKIDLRPGAFSNIGGWTRNVSVARGVQIEAAIGGTGSDTIIAGSGASDLIGGAGGDFLYGGTGNDHLYGGGRQAVDGDLNDYIEGGAGNDYIQGNAGGDRISGGEGSDRIYGGRDDDRIDGDAGNDSVNGNVGNDTVDGGGGNDYLRGGQGNDLLRGGADDDVLLGDLGDDRLDGGTGFDLLVGGRGSDTFVLPLASYRRGTEIGTTGIIQDFEDTADRLTYGTVPVDVLRSEVDAGASSAGVVEAAFALFGGFGGQSRAAAIGYRGDTYLFLSPSQSGDTLAGVRLVGIGPAAIDTGDFV